VTEEKVAWVGKGAADSPPGAAAKHRPEKINKNTFFAFINRMTASFAHGCAILQDRWATGPQFIKSVNESIYIW